jgi:hypothetical protein
MALVRAQRREVRHLISGERRIDLRQAKPI